MYRSAALIAVFLATTALCACSTQPLEEAGLATVRIIATQNFGQELMFDETLEVPAGTPAMAALMEVAEVETAYGGGFVNAINGLRSEFGGGQGAQQDWFIYINGIESNVGALNYKLHDGDVQHWDFHDWSFHTFAPANIGAFPEPFLHGYGGKTSPTVIVYPDGLREEAGALRDKFVRVGVSDVAIKRFGGLSADEKELANLILLGTADSEPVSELDRVWKRLGFFAHFQDSSLVVLNSRGEVASEYGDGTGIVQATQSLWNPNGVGACENVVWMVSGTDEAGVKSAIDALINHHAEFQYAHAIVVASGKIIRVPQ